MRAKSVPLQGRLEDHSLASVLRLVLAGSRDGCLTVVRGPVTRRLYFRGGMITSASSTDPHDRLGEILIAQGKLTQADHVRYWERSRAEGRRLGQTLVVNGMITPTDLFHGVTAQVVTILDRVQKWRKGEYAFEEGREPESGTVLLRIPLALYLRADTDKPRRAKAPGTGKKAAAVAAVAAPAEPPRAEPPPAAAAGADAELELELETAGGEGGTADAGAGAPAAEPVILVPDIPAPSAGAATAEERVAEVEFHVQELRKRVGQEPAALLGVAAGAGRAEAQEAFRRLARILHPDAMPAGIPPEVAAEAEEIFRAVSAALEAFPPGPKAATPAALSAPQRLRPPAEPEDPARQLFQRGREFIAKGNWWQAADALRQAVRIQPKDAIYRQYLGLSLVKIKRHHEAEEHLVAATRLEPNNAVHFVNLGRIYASGRFIRKAREAYERAVRLDPRNDAAREELRDLPEELPPSKGRPGAPGGSLLRKIFGKG